MKAKITVKYRGKEAELPPIEFNDEEMPDQLYKIGVELAIERIINNFWAEFDLDVEILE